MAVDAPEPTPFNPYATPKAVVGELPTEPNSQPTFFPVGRMKLALMSIVTFGLYLVYWSYQNWKSVERLNNEELGAPLRAFFYPLTSYYLFQRIEGHVVPMQIKIAIQPGVLALGVVILAVSWRLPDP